MSGLFRPNWMLGRYERAKVGSAEEAAEFMRKNFHASGALVYIVLPTGGIRTSFSGSPSLLPQLPNLLRQLAADYERKLEFQG
jgi:hypothetical protein